MKVQVLTLVLALAALATAQPTIVPTNYLNTMEPQRMCDSYIRAKYGLYTTAFTQPTGGALLRVEISGPQTQDRCVYIFCDNPTHRLLIYTLTETALGRVPYSVKGYGLQIAEDYWVFGGNDSAASVIAPYTNRECVGCLDRPIDVATSACGRHFDPSNDYVFVLDQAAHRVVKLRYDVTLDSLIWVSSFGADHLKRPTALDYADYGDANSGNDDIYITDAARSNVLRFSASGVYETSYGGWGPNLASISNPTGVAVSTSPSFPRRFYVTDSHNHRVVRYYSDTNGSIIAERQHIFPLMPWPMINSVDTDAEGNVYVVNTFTHYITVLSASLDSVLTTFGGLGYEPGQFDSPSDIYIDNHEIQVCELFADSSGIQSFAIVPGTPKMANAPLPGKFHLAQNYPNPFNSSTTIMFEIPQSGRVEIIIYNILGQKVLTLADEFMAAGQHSRIWNGVNQSGEPVSSGMYFYRLRFDDKADSKKLLLLK